MIPDRQTHGGLRRSTVIWSAGSTANLLVSFQPALLGPNPGPGKFTLKGETCCECVCFNGGEEGLKKKSGEDGVS